MTPKDGLSFKVDFQNMDQLIANMDKAGGDARPLIRAAVTNAATHIQAEARQRAPHRTGTLQRSILVEKKDLGAVVKVNEKYGIFIEYGTGPFDIFPRNKKALMWPGADHPYRKVHHPGIKARPFFKPGIEASMPYVEQQFHMVGVRIVKEIAHGRI